MKRVGCLLLLAVLLISAGCKEKEVQEITYEPVAYTPVTPDDELKETLTGVVSTYLSALENHDYSLLMNCADDRLPLCNNETAFYDYTVGIGSALLDGIDFDCLLQDGKNYLLKVSYTITFTSPFTDIDGQSKEPCTQEHMEQMTLCPIDGDYHIIALAETGEG